MRNAVEKSLNVPPVSIVNELGISYCADYARKFGLTIDRNDEFLPLTLGGMTKGLNAVELSGAYSTLSNLGNYKKPSFIRRIEDGYGNVLYCDNRSFSSVESEENVFLMNDMLNSTVKDGTAKRLSSLKYDVFAKTGTVASNNADYNEGAYCAAFTSCHTAIIWLGDVTGEPQNGIPATITGANCPTEIVKSVFNELYNDYSPSGYDVPDSLVSITYDEQAYLNDGVIIPCPKGTENSSTDYFRKSALPDEIIDVKSYDVEDFTLDVTEEGVKISFSAKKWINYKVSKQYGITEEILSDSTYEEKEIALIDRNTIEGECYSYTILPYIMNFYGEIVEGKPITKTIILNKDPYGDEYDGYFE